MRLTQRCREFQAPTGHSFSNGIVETRLVERQDSAAQRLNSGRITINARDRRAKCRQACGGNEADITGTHDRKRDSLYPHIHRRIIRAPITLRK